MKSQVHIEESVDSLIKRLEGQGKKVKIIEEEDDDKIQDEDEDQLERRAE